MSLATTGLATGVRGQSTSTDGIGVFGQGDATTGFATGVRGDSASETGRGVIGWAMATTGVNYGVMGLTNSTVSGFAGAFFGNVQVTGTLSKGGGSFKIDHPLDPENKYLYHSFVESPDMMDIYNGDVTTDGDGYASIVLPEWFEALNRDFRYQLTVIDDGPAFVLAKVVRKIAGNRFTIRTSQPRTEISWQVPGVRRDAFAEKHRIPVEEDKPETERGRYLYPAEHDQPAEKGINYERLRGLVAVEKSSIVRALDERRRYR